MNARQRSSRYRGADKQVCSGCCGNSKETYVAGRSQAGGGKRWARERVVLGLGTLERTWAFTLHEMQSHGRLLSGK